MITASSASGCSWLNSRACGPHECFISAGLRPAGSLSAGDAGVLVTCGFHSFLSVSRRSGVAPVTLVTFCNQTSHMREHRVSLYRKLRVRTSLTSHPLAHRWLLRNHPGCCTWYRPEQPFALNNVAQGAHVLRAPQGVGAGRRQLPKRTTRVLGRTVPVWETALRDLVATQDASP